MKKIFLLIVVALVIVGAIFVFVTRDYWWQKYLTQKYLREFASLEEAYKNDTNGGSTPEETLQLLIKALEKKDAKLASSYFIPEKRNQMKEDFEAGLKSGGVDKFVSLIRDSKIRKYDLNADYSRLTVALVETDNFLTFDLIKNNDKWLIKSL